MAANIAMKGRPPDITPADIGIRERHFDSFLAYLLIRFIPKPTELMQSNADDSYFSHYGSSFSSLYLQISQADAGLK